MRGREGIENVHDPVGVGTFGSASKASAVTMPFKVCVHRGTRQIGGTCVELEYDGARLLLDLGLPLDADTASDPTVLLPEVPGLRALDPNLLALVLSHGHADHWGLASYAHSSLPAVMGAATRRILLAAAPFVPRPMPFAVEGSGLPEFVDRVPLRIGPFTLTPYLVDHSAYDAYALLVEAGGRRLFYSGDIRTHGRKGEVFERLLRDPPRFVHTMLMEGSSLGCLEQCQGSNTVWSRPKHRACWPTRRPFWRSSIRSA